MSDTLDLLRTALLEENWEVANRILGSFPADFILPPEDGERATYLALALRAEETPAPDPVLQRLIKATYKDQFQDIGPTGETLLHICTLYQHDEATTRAIAEENPEAIVMFDDYGDTPIDNLLGQEEFSRLAEEEKADILKMLLEMCTAPQDARNEMGENLLHRAFRRGNLRDLGLSEDVVLESPVLGVFLEYASRMVFEKDSEGVTPLHLAATQCYVGLDNIRFLVRETHCAPDGLDMLLATDSNGWTPLHHAVTKVSPTTLCQLSGYCPKALTVRDKQGRTPLALFREKHREKLIFSSTKYWSMCERLGACIKHLMHHYPDPVPLDYYLDNENDWYGTDMPPNELELRTLLGRQNFTADLAHPILVYLQDHGEMRTKWKGSTDDTLLHLMCKRNPTWDEESQYCHALKALVKMYPKDCRARNDQGMLPLTMMAQAGHSWNHGIKVLIEAYPGAALDLDLSRPRISCELLSKLGNIGPDTLFRFLRDAPFVIQQIYTPGASLEEASAIEEPPTKKRVIAKNSWIGTSFAYVKDLAQYIIGRGQEG